MRHTLAHLVGNASLEMLFKGGLGLLFCCVSMVSNADDSTTHQRTFEKGVAAMFRGDYSESQRIFQSLYVETQSPRAKLEWARSAYLAGDFRLARKLFREVYEAPNTPDLVRFNISLFLSEIASEVGVVDYSLKFVSDSNPYSVSNTQEVTIFGLPFTYKPPQPKKALNGLNLWFQYTRPINARESLRFLSELNGTKFSGKNENKGNISLAMQHFPNDQSKFSYRFGKDLYWEKSAVIAEQNFLSAQYTLRGISQDFSNFSASVRLSQNHLPDFSLANGETLSTSISISRPFFSRFQVGGTLGLNETVTRDPTYGNNGHNIGLGVKLFFPTHRLQLDIDYVWAHRFYNEQDALFLVHRKDREQAVIALLKFGDFHLFGMYPSLILQTSVTDSSISIYSIEKRSASFLLSRRF